MSNWRVDSNTSENDFNDDQMHSDNNVSASTSKEFSPNGDINMNEQTNEENILDYSNDSYKSEQNKNNDVSNQFKSEINKKPINSMKKQRRRVVSRSPEYMIIDPFKSKEQLNVDVYMRNSSKNISKIVNVTLPEDIRISKLLRKLYNENNPGPAIELCDKLKQVIADPANHSYIRKSFDILAETIISIFRNGTDDYLEHVTEVFGLMGYVIRNDFHIYKQWILNNFKMHKKLQIYMMKSLRVTIVKDKETLSLKQSSIKLTGKLKEFLENTVHPDIFIEILKVITEIANNYPDSIEPHFIDFVDILVGWHLSTEQSIYVKNQCALALQEFKIFWTKDLKYTHSLLGHFLEDIQACEDDMVDHTEDFIKNVSSFISTFNTVIKCIYTKPEHLVYLLGKEILVESFEIISSASKLALINITDDGLIISLNEYLVIILKCSRYNLQLNFDDLYTMIELQLNIIDRLSDNEILSLLMVILKTILEVKTAIPLNFITILLSGNSKFFGIRFHKNEYIQKCLIRIVQEILNLKNVEILKHTYNYLLIDVGIALKSLPNTENIEWDFVNNQSTDNVEKSYTIHQAEFIINFNFSALSSLITPNTSIIAMYALKPSVLELLTTRLHITNPMIWNNFQNIHFMILNLITSHCRKNNYFITSSNLLPENNYKDIISKISIVNNSPTSDHCEIIIKLLSEIFLLDLCKERLLILLDFINNLILQLKNYSNILSCIDNFNKMIIGINKLSLKSNCDFDVIKKCAECIDSLFEFDEINSEVYMSIAEICSVKMCSNYPEIRKTYSMIFSKIPLEYSLKQVNNYTGINLETYTQCSSLQTWLYAYETKSALQPEYFKKFINGIGFNMNEMDSFEKFLLHIFNHSWHVEQGKSYEFSKFSIRDIRGLICWAQLEAAQFCVNNKLKTPLGKAQETFLSIESIIKEDARILAMKEKWSMKKINTILINQKHARILLGFLEILEKVIYNAANGTAFSMPAPDKTVRTFFRVNYATCDEWFNRIRSAVNLVGIHCMEPEMVIRYTEQILKRLIKTNKVDDIIFEETIMSLTWALLKNGESSALYGLYTWSKTVSRRKFTWIKMVAEQAAGKRESAIDGYFSILKSEDCPKSQYIREFIIDQLILCLLHTHQYNELHKLLLDEESRDTDRITIKTIRISSKQIEDMIKFENIEDQSLDNLSNWECLDRTSPIENFSDFSYYELISLTENTLTKAIMTDQLLSEETAYSCFQVIQNSLQECMRSGSKEHVNHLTILNHVCQKIYQEKTINNKQNIKSFYINKNYGSTTLIKLLSWCENISKITENLNDFEEQIVNLRLDVSAMARKEGNLQFCRTELNKFFNKSIYAYEMNLYGKLNIECLQENLIKIDSITNTFIWDENMSRAVYETCKLLHCLPKQKYSAIQLAASTSMGICYTLQNYPNSSIILKQRAARILLTLSEWLQMENDTIITNDQSSSLVQLLASLPDVKPHPDESTPSVIPLIESCVGKLIQYGIKQCPDLAKAWGSFGNWCYKWGRKMVEIRNEDNDKAGLRVSDVTAISNLIPNVTPEDLQIIVEILNQHQVTAEEEDIDPNDTSSTEMIENQLRLLPILANQSQEQLHSIVEIWRQAHKSAYGYYEMAADAYFKYLQLTTKSDYEYEENESCSNVTATLRLLRLVVKHALGLQEVLEEGLASTPTTPWKVIIPQLFSRMNHHEPYVRRRMSELICRVAKDAPHLIIFPTVVGAGQGHKTDLANISITSEDLEYENSSSNQVDSGLVCCFNSLLETLSQQTPETVNQVQLLVRELKRITLLWDELWLVTLAQIYSEWLKKFVSFEQHVQKFKDSCAQDVDKNTIISGKYNLMMKPVIFVMERLFEITSRKPETNNEKMFQEKYLNIIEKIIQDLKKPFKPDQPNNTWQTFKSFYSILQHKSQRKSASTLKMTDISPILAQLKNTVISMPGVETNGKYPVYIRSVENSVHILPSKTKPKKLVFIGSNGKRYTYLFKSLEDLHLDERIMQFLSISNTMMNSLTDCNGQISNYRARHYSVIPLGPRSGLISWVDGVVPIFAIYKKWQQREAAYSKKDKNSGTILRPSEMFYNKLNPLLIENGIKPSSNRKEWPLKLLTTVLTELSKETPCDLLAKELWCHSTTSSSWRQVIKNYSLSLAVMSVIGYVIGLGDRHLDNILLELSSGEILHIDYNVCFEKGHTLRVPEKVPFRMTQNLEEALGITGVQGTFWLACEHVLKALKKGRETLLTLLEAFVYDPLVDWAVGEDGAGDLAVTAYGGEALGGELRQARKQLEREITRDTLAIRITEIKPDWIHFRDEISKQLIVMQENLHELKNHRNELQNAEKQLDLLSKQMALIREAETLGSAIESHLLGTVSQRYGIYKKTKDEFDASKSILIQKSINYDKQLNSYKNCLDDIQNNKIIEYIQESKQLMENVLISEFDAVQEFLANSTQTQIYTQCEHARKELDSSLYNQISLVIKGFDELLRYSEIIKYYPKSYTENHRYYRYSQWSKILCNEKSVDSCRDIVAQYNSIYGKDTIKPSVQNIFSFSTHIQNIIKELNFKLQKLYDQVNVEFGPNIDIETHVNVQNKIYTDAKLSVSQFLKQDINSYKSFECVIISALCTINKRFLVMENAAAISGENLVDLTSNGKWFLEELYMSSYLVSELCDILSFENYKNEFLNSSLKMLKQSSRVYSTLYMMNQKFLLNVLPDIMQGIMSEDETVLNMISSVSNLQQGLLPLTELLQNLDLHLRYILLNKMSPNYNTISLVDELKIKLYNLKEKYETDESNSLGGRLFLKFNEIFDDLQLEHNNLINIIDTIDLHKDWHKFDQIKDAKNLANFVFNRKTRAVLENIFIVKRLETMIEFFTLCLKLAFTFKGASGSNDIYEDDYFFRPIKKYIADHVLRLLLGVSPFSITSILCHLLEQNGFNIENEINLNDIGAQTKISLEEICKKGYDLLIKNGNFNSLIINNATSLCATLDFSLRKKEIIKNYNNMTIIHTANINRLQIILTTYHWIHEDVINISGITINTITRTHLIISLGNLISKLHAWKSTISKIKDDINVCVSTVLQRLRWAAGANPALVETLAGFENLSSINREEVDKHCLLAAVVLGYLTTILNYERMRIESQENLEQDQIFLNDVSRWEKSCIMSNSCANAVSPVEEALVELLDPEGPIDNVWLNNVKTLLNDMTEQVEEDIDRIEKNLGKSQDNLQKCGHKLRQLIHNHNQISSDVITMLKTTLKHDCDKSIQTKEYLTRYKQYNDMMGELQGSILSKDFTAEILSEILEHTNILLTNTNNMFDKLFCFENTKTDDRNIETENRNLKTSDFYQMSPGKKNKAQNQTEQKKNAYAVSVWRRIRMKLEGRDPDPTRRSSVQEQVNWMIREAMNTENLAVLYEGWTPWI